MIQSVISGVRHNAALQHYFKARRSKPAKMGRKETNGKETECSPTMGWRSLTRSQEGCIDGIETNDLKRTTVEVCCIGWNYVCNSSMADWKEPILLHSTRNLNRVFSASSWYFLMWPCWLYCSWMNWERSIKTLTRVAERGKVSTINNTTWRAIPRRRYYRRLGLNSRCIKSANLELLYCYSPVVVQHVFIIPWSESQIALQKWGNSTARVVSQDRTCDPQREMRTLASRRHEWVEAPARATRQSRSTPKHKSANCQLQYTCML